MCIYCTCIHVCTCVNSCVHVHVDVQVQCLTSLSVVCAPKNWIKGKLLGSGAFGQVCTVHVHVLQPLECVYMYSTCTRTLQYPWTTLINLMRNCIQNVLYIAVVAVVSRRCAA